jgi:hypothetical protein
MLNRRTVITFEKLERCFYRLSDSAPVIEHCPECCAEVSWVTPDQAVVLTGLSLREIFRRVEANVVHFNEAEPRRLLICPTSLFISTRSRSD